MRQGGPDPYNFRVASWDQETETLVIRCNQDIPEEENAYVNITNLNTIDGRASSVKAGHHVIYG